MTSPPTRRRPLIVTIAVIVVFASGLFNSAAGLLVLLDRYRVPADQVLPVSLLGAAIILAGLLTLAVASATARGSRLARTLLTVYIVAQFVLHAITIAATDWDAAAIVQIALEVFVVIALWAPPGSRYFARRP